MCKWRMCIDKSLRLIFPYVFFIGTNVLPGPVTDLEVFSVNQTAVRLEWNPPTDSNVSSYEVYHEIWNDDNSRQVSCNSKDYNVICQ